MLQMGENALYDGGVGMLDVVETCAGALQCLARDPANRQIIKEHNLIPVFVQVCHFDAAHSVCIGGLAL